MDFAASAALLLLLDRLHFQFSKTGEFYGWGVGVTLSVRWHRRALAYFRTRSGKSDFLTTHDLPICRAAFGDGFIFDGRRLYIQYSS